MVSKKASKTSKKKKSKQAPRRGLYIVMLSPHGLIRGHDLELGRDADTGGQTQYVVELARALAAQRAVERVDLLTRQIFDAKVSDDYAEPQELIGHASGDDARIVRLPFGPRRYLSKESLWNYLDSFVDNALKHVRSVARVPDAIHSHYADAGYVGARLAGLLEVPLIHTGHSLGRLKRESLKEKGVKEASLEKNYNMTRRIEAEEEALASADRVIASTGQEIEEQYAKYDHYQPKRMVVIPPGIDLERFYPPSKSWKRPPIKTALERFLRKPNKPMILAVSRADERKNISTLVQAFAENDELRELANLVIVAGNRERIRDLEKGARNVLSELLMQIDNHDLYGVVAYPKHHRAEDVPELYRLATRSQGVFVNPALTEPFGLTLVEAAASGLPMVATADGGPTEIQANCDNGELVNPLDDKAMGQAIVRVLEDKDRWRRLSANAAKGARKHYTWSGHARKYVDLVRQIASERGAQPEAKGQGRLMFTDRALISDIDDTLLGDAKALAQLLKQLQRHRDQVGFGVATGRSVDSAVKILEEWSVPVPDVLITAVGTEIYYGAKLTYDRGWRRHISHRWQPDALRKLMAKLPGLELQDDAEQRELKISYNVDAKRLPDWHEIVRQLHRHDLRANVIFSHSKYLDLVPVRASKGFALRFFSYKWDIPLDNILVAGDSGNDADMLRGQPLAAIVGNHHTELEVLRGLERTYFADGHHARGILEALEHYDFFGRCEAVEPAQAVSA